ncbi:hypothetical protein N7494_009516 [Penicillium frequentans]|uniref:Uncharacterized protein n=1 Tax=Penicillium frequentans TaxID=3151616 RepID=A0AAD6CRU9_9EURO|nr:hypothetical protein N7494_009516 [Penicillium glabrum]
MSDEIHEKDDSTILAATEEKSENKAGAEAAFVYLDGWALGFLALALMGSGFLLPLDDTILCTEPGVWNWSTNGFHRLNDVGRYGAAYLVTQMSRIPTCSRIYTFYDVRWS